MAKKHFLTLFTTLVLAFGWAYPSTYLFNEGNTTLDTVECDEPAPDSFRVLSRGPNFVTLGWKPAWEQATYSLEVFINSGQDSWTPFSIYSSINSSSLTIDNLPFGADCRFVLSTNCVNGGSSVYKSILHDKIIIDLEIGGRIPMNPSTVSCTNINLEKFEWVGFEVRHRQLGNTVFNLFEFEFDPDADEGPTMRIKRVYDNTTVYAVNAEGNYPPPLLYPNNPFEIGKKLPNGTIDEIGYVGATIIFGEKLSVELCPDIINHSWDDIFTFKALVAESLAGTSPGAPSGHGFGNRPSKLPKESGVAFNIICPFQQELNISLAENSYIRQVDYVDFCLFDLNGQKVLEKKHFEISENLAIPTYNVAPGIYFAQIESQYGVQAIKVIKTNQ